MRRLALASLLALLVGLGSVALGDGFEGPLFRSPQANGFRLTLESAVPISTGAVTGSTLYLTPSSSGEIWTRDSSSWSQHFSDEVSLSIAALTTSSNYDVFAYWDGALVLELGTAWTNSSTRSQAIVRDSGVWVKSADHRRRYVGTVRALTQTTLTDTPARRWVWNAENQATRSLAASVSSTTWTYSTATWREFSADTTDGHGRVSLVTGLRGTHVSVSVKGCAVNSGGTVAVAVGVGLDSTTTNVAQVFGGYVGTARANRVAADYEGELEAGAHVLQALEIATALGTTTWTGTDGSLVLTGLTGTVRQ